MSVPPGPADSRPGPAGSGPGPGVDPADPARAGLDAGAVVDRLRAAGCVFAEEEAQLLLSCAGSPQELAGWVHRRVAGEPLEQLLGWAGFAGLRIAVTPGVFVPRRRTELLVRQAIPVLAAVRDQGRPAPVLLDLCCGSGAVGVALAVLAGPVELHAADVDPAAVGCARRNLEALVAGTGSPGQVYLGDLYAPLPSSLRGTVDLLVVNAPYVPTAQIAMMPPEARLYERPETLDGGPDGLDVVRRAAAGACDWLVPGGHLLVETSRRQAPLLLEVLSATGLRPRTVTDESLDATAVLAFRPAS
jgi:release factor glutamine methyltransferase